MWSKNESPIDLARSLPVKEKAARPTWKFSENDKMGLQIAAWEEYRGCALVRYDLIEIPPEKTKFLLEQDVQWWMRILKSDRCRSDQLAHAPIVTVSQAALEDARRDGTSGNEGGLPSLAFKEHQIVCLDGQSRIRAALGSVFGPGTSRFGPVHIVLNSKY